MAKTKKISASLIFGMFFLAINLLPLAVKASGCISGGIDLGVINIGGSLGDCGGGKFGGGGGVFQSIEQTGLPGGSIIGIIEGAMYWLLAIFGMIGVIGFLISGILYLTSAGDEDQLKKAKSSMTWSIVGVIVGLAGLVIIGAINTWLSGSSSSF